ncbi:MAG: ABC transporter permease [Coriobacteriia bacterium]|nr:ABC transporter permease [Coriobacteriia bacterium]
MSRASRVRGFVAPSIALVIYLALAAYPPIWEAVLGRMFPGESRLLYQQAGMLTLIGQHATMVGISSLASAIIGISLGVFVTRPVGADFHDTVADLANLGQTFPPIAVLTLAVPLLGFGFEPTVFALTLYGVLPVLQNTIAGIRSIPAAITESARGMGMTPAQVLFRAELPAAAGGIFAGVRVSVVVNVATAAIGAAIGAGGLGVPIISGLVNYDPAVTLQGGVLAAVLALILDAYLGAAQRGFVRTAQLGTIT